MMPMISAAWPYVLSLASLAAILFLFAPPIFGALPLILAAAIGLFFRDPERRIPGGESNVVSPADGRVVEVTSPAGGASGRIAIFLSIFNVHVNRSPVRGTVRSVVYKPGEFRPAYQSQASSSNERNTLEVNGPLGRFDVSQIAGLIARRIHCFKKEGDPVLRGERIGYIAFGSRTELTLPPGCRVLVKVGDNVRGGETIVATADGPAGGAL